MEGPVGTTVVKPEWKNWRIIYPLYLNAKKTEAEGRRVGKARCVDNPTSNEIAEACKKLNYAAQVELDKNHPRDHLRQGRVRVDMKGAAEKTSSEWWHSVDV